MIIFEFSHTNTRTHATLAATTGQDGSYLAEFLLHKGYVVYGLMRRSSSFNTGRIEHIYKDKHQRAVRCVPALRGRGSRGAVPP